MLLSTVTTSGTAVDITVAEPNIEAFLPANESTADALRQLACLGLIGLCSYS